MDDQLSPTGQSALWHAARIGAVFPCEYPIRNEDGVRCSCGKTDCDRIGKHPMFIGQFRRGFHDATRDLRALREVWGRRQLANPALAVPPGVFILDIDPRSGGDESAAQLEHQYGPLPETCVVASGRNDGGKHLYIQRPDGPITSTRLPRGLDLKDAGKGYVMLPGSIHAATGQPYRWEKFGPPAECPGWLWRLLRAVPVQRTASAPRRPTANSSDQGLVDWLASQGEGNRNRALFWACCRAAERQAPNEIFDALVDVAVSIGLTEAESRRTADSARRRIGVAA